MLSLSNYPERMRVKEKKKGRILKPIRQQNKHNPINAAKKKTKLNKHTHREKKARKIDDIHLN